jgi:hypothetical protein
VWTVFSTEAVIARARSTVTFSTGATFYIGLVIAFPTKAASSTHTGELYSNELHVPMSLHSLKQEGDVVLKAHVTNI